MKKKFTQEVTTRTGARKTRLRTWVWYALIALIVGIMCWHISVTQRLGQAMIDYFDEDLPVKGTKSRDMPDNQ